jgi:putative transcription factor
MCGKDAPTSPTLLEGTTLQLCEKCGKYGKVLAPPKAAMQKQAQKQHIVRAAEPSFAVVDDYAERIRKARARLGLTQKEFALKLNEKESVLQKLENGSHEPSIDLARKLERLLHITLVEEEKEEKTVAAKDAGGGMTIGDLVKNR